jgi:hypothetical protein
MLKQSKTKTKKLINKNKHKTITLTMEELLEKVNNLSATVARIEAMMLEDREQKKKNQINQKAISIKNNQTQIDLCKKNQNRQRRELEEEEDPDERKWIQEQIDDYDIKIKNLESKQK